MKNIITVVIICTFSHLVFSQGFGIGTTSPSQKLDVAVWIKVGNQTQGSTATTGTLRYNTSGKLEFYNGSSWVGIVAASTTYIRWGRDDCPATSSLVYWGYAASGHYNHNGSGANHLCLTSTPSWSGASYHDASQNGALLYGTEFETSGYGVSTLVNRYQYDARCALCLVDAASVSLMIPGTVSCPSGWTRQYWGYIMATHYTQIGKSEFVCVDNAPDIIAGTNTNHNGALWYPTEKENGSLGLPGPYPHDREITCVVCTQ